MNKKQDAVKPKFFIGVFWGCLLSIPFWALFISILFYILKN